MVGSALAAVWDSASALAVPPAVRLVLAPLLPKPPQGLALLTASPHQSPGQPSALGQLRAPRGLTNVHEKPQAWSDHSPGLDGPKANPEYPHTGQARGPATRPHLPLELPGDTLWGDGPHCPWVDAAGPVSLGWAGGLDLGPQLCCEGTSQHQGTS